MGFKFEKLGGNDIEFNSSGGLILNNYSPNAVEVTMSKSQT